MNYNLFYINNQNKSPLPEFCHFYWELGQCINEQIGDNSRLVIGLALPTGAYAAAYISLGLVIARSKNINIDPRDHFEKLYSLTPGTPLIYRNNNRKKFAILDSTNEFCGKKVILIKTQNEKGGNLLEYIYEESSLKVALASSDTTSILPANQKGRIITKRKSFLERIIDGIDPTLYASVSILECILIGNLKKLKQEIKETELAVKSNQKYEDGALQDILRVRNFLGNNIAYRTEILSNNDDEIISKAKNAPFVIFDGARGFLRWNNELKNCNTIIILDKTETDFHTAAEMINKEFIQCRTEDEVNLEIKEPPPGIEMIVFKEALS